MKLIVHGIIKCVIDITEKIIELWWNAIRVSYGGMRFVAELWGKLIRVVHCPLDPLNDLMNSWTL